MFACVRRSLSTSTAAQLIGLRRPLADLVVDVKKLESLPSDQLELLWEEYHAPERSENSEVQIVGRTVAADKFLQVKRNAEQSPLYVLPNIRESANKQIGFCTLFTEFSPKTDFVLMTLLDEYRTQGPAASPWLSISMFDNVSSAANLVLVQTKFNALQLTRLEAQQLTNKWIDVYTQPLEQPNSPYMFNHKPETFNFEQAFKIPVAMP